MLYRKVSGIATELSVLSFGGAAVSGEGGGYGFGSISENGAEALLKAAWDHGINVFDTAPIYGFGLSEERFGRHLPKEAFIISKSGVDWHENRRVNMSNSRLVTEKMLHQSLRRLQRDCIDLYMIHWPDPRVPLEEPLSVLLTAQAAGKIKHIGLCNTTAKDLRIAEEMCQIVSLQSELNLFTQTSFEQLGDAWRDKFSMGWGTFDKGILSGRVTKNRQFEKDDCRSWAPWWKKKEVEKKIQRVEKLNSIIRDDSFDLSDLCVQFALFQFNLSSCLIGFKSVEDIVKATKSLHGPVIRERISEVLKEWDLSLEE